MMPAPGEGFGSEETTPYDEARGTCPRCGSTEVRHLVIGLPASEDDMTSGPTWVSWVGCVHPGYTRVCDACGHTWSPR